MIGNKERFRLCQQESFSVSGREEADSCTIGRTGGEAAMGSQQEEGRRRTLCSWRNVERKSIHGRDGPLPYRVGRPKNEEHNARRH